MQHYDLSTSHHGSGPGEADQDPCIVETVATHRVRTILLSCAP